MVEGVVFPGRMVYIYIVYYRGVFLVQKTFPSFSVDQR